MGGNGGAGYADRIRFAHTLDEARILTAGDRLAAAINVLERARKRFPEDPDVLAELGYVRARNSPASGQPVDGLDLIRRAIQSRPDEGRYHYYLADSLGPGGAENWADAVRESYQAARLTTGQDHLSRIIRKGALENVWDLFNYRFGPEMKDGVLRPKIEMPFAEAAGILEYLIANDPDPGFSGTFDEKHPEEVSDPYVKLAVIYRGLGRLDEAARVLRTALGNDDAQWCRRAVSGPSAIRLKVYAGILQDGGFDPQALAKVRTRLMQPNCG